jgi:hypothetical protein
MLVIVGVAAASIAIVALATAIVVLTASYARLPPRLALQIASDGALIGPGPRRNLWLAPALLAFALISPLLTASYAVRTNRPLSATLLDADVGALVLFAFASTITAANIMIVVRAAVTGRVPSARRLAWGYRLIMALAFPVVAFLVWLAYDVAHPA